jgi:glycosyltransferase involved in cell wall biosynthesis
MKPRVLFVGRTRYRLPLEGGLARKWDALGERMEVRAIAAGTGSDPRFRLVRPRPLDGPRFYAGLPFRVAREIRSFGPDAVVAETPYEGIAVELARRVSRVRVRTVVEVHGDWRTSTRLYGSPLRRLVAPLGDRLAAWAIRRADAVRTLSPFTSGLVRRLGVEPAAEFIAFVDLDLFAASAPAPLPERPQALFVGVLERYKNVDGLVGAWRSAAPRAPEARLQLVGEGPLRPLVQELGLEGQAAWTPRLTPAEVVAALDASTCLVLPSRSEGLPRPRDRRVARRRHPRHRRGRRQRPARRAGPPGRRARADPDRPRAGRAPRPRCARVVAALALVGGRVRREHARGRGGGDGAVSKPRVLLVARTRYELPLSPSLERKFAALRERLELRVLATAADGRARDDGTFRLLPRLPALDGLLFWALLPYRVRRIVRQHGAAVIVAQSPYEAAFVLLARTKAKLVVELHGDWRTATRLYGSPVRRALSPLADAVAAWAVRRADAVRTVSAFTSGLAREQRVEPAGEFTTFVDLELFTETPPGPLPPTPTALFVGVLELYKNLDGLVRAWRLAAPRLPGARLEIVGRGSRRDLAEELVRDLPEQVSWVERLDQRAVVRALDEATCLVLPSRSEGLPRIVVEALCRGRAVVAARGGGIPDVVEDGANGLLVDPDDVEALAAALERVLGDPALARCLGECAHERAAAWVATPAEYADNLAGVVGQALSYTGSR